MDKHILESLAWTLIHSLWQAAIIFAIISLLMKSMSRTSAQHRYAAWISGLVLVAVSSLATFFIVYSGVTGGASLSVTGISTHSIQLTDVVTGAAPSLLASTTAILNWIDLNILWIMRVWAVGTILGLLRMVSGVAYLSFLRSRVKRVSGLWEEKLLALADKLRISKTVGLFEGAVSAPVVIGYLKPLIVFPVGMLAGLSSSQVEAILIHELAHIRRHDFIVNVLQCLIESLLFFNPFVWMMSARVRSERENCCDDIVIEYGVEPVVYVKALAAVEGVYSNTSLAMGLLGQKNQLLNRMKRVMEKSAGKELNAIKLLPLSLVVIGLVCASWLSISDEDKFSREGIDEGPAVVSYDTTVAPETKSKSTDVSADDDNTYTYSYRSLDVAPPAMEHIAGVPLPPMAGFRYLDGDSIPGAWFTPDSDWEKFEKEFTAKFRDEFGKFFEQNEEQFEKMMQELRERHADESFLSPNIDALNADQMRAMEEYMSLINPAMENFKNFNIPELTEKAMRMQEQAMLLSERAMAEHARVQFQFDTFKLREKAMWDQKWMMFDQENLKKYEEELREQLIEDGYLEKDEKINELQIMNGEVTVNGKKVKKADEDKYKVIIQRHKGGFYNLHHRPE